MVEIKRGPIDPATGQTQLERKFRGQPRKTTLEDRNRTGIGLIAMAVIAVLLAGLVILTKVGPGYQRVSADFIQAAALLPKNPVTVAGIPVGKVTGMHLNGDHVDRRHADPEQRRRSARTPAPSSWSPPFWVRGIWRCIPAAVGRCPTTPSTSITPRCPTTCRRRCTTSRPPTSRSTPTSSRHAVEMLGKQLQGLPPMIPRSMDNIKTLSTIIADRRDQLGSMLKTMELVTATLRRQQSSIGAMVNQGQRAVR